MARLLKWIGGLIGLLVVLVVVIVVAFAVLVDPNDYREQISAQVKQHTGRELKIEGDISLSFFPWLGLELGRMELGNAEGFGPEPFAGIEAADAKVKILPILRGAVEMDTVVLHGLQLSLSRKADGTSNWDDLAGDGTEQAPHEADQEGAGQGAGSAEQTLKELAIGGIEIRNANIRWNDEVAGQSAEVRDFNFITGAINLEQPIPLTLNAIVSLSQPALEAQLELTTAVALDMAQKRYRLDDTRLGVTASGEVIPGGKARLDLGADIAADLEQQTASVSGMTLSALGATLKGQVDASNILDEPSFSGSISSDEFVPRDVMASAAITLPEMADPSTLTRAQLSVNFSGGLDSLVLKKLSAQFDDTTLSGNASVKQFAAPVIRYQLALDEIDVDRYLPPPSDEPQAGSSAEVPTAAAESAPAELPLEMLRSLDIDGTFKVGKVKVMNLKSDTIVTTVRAEDGLFRVNPLTANLYQGSYSGDLRFDVRQDTPKLGMDEKLSGVEAGPLLKDFLGKDYATGRANLAARLTATGIEPMAVRKSLNGNGSFSFEDGQVKGVNIGYLLRKGYALYKQQPAPEEEVEQTDFTALKGTFKVKNGLVTTSDLSARSPLFSVDGKGDANLVNEKLDMRLDTTIVSNLKNAANQDIDELKGVTVPITIKGSFSEPSFGVDVKSVLKAKVKARVDEEKAKVEAKIEAEKAAAKAEAKKRAEEEKKKLEEKAKDKLKDMFKF